MVAEVTLPPQEDAGWGGGVLDTSWLNRLVVVSLHSRTACVHTAHPMTATDACLLRRGRNSARGSHAESV